MAYRSGIQKLLTRSQAAGKTLSSVSSPSQTSSFLSPTIRRPEAQFVISQDHANCGDDFPGWEGWDRTSYFLKFSASSHDTDERNEGSPRVPCMVMTVQKVDWDRNVNSMTTKPVEEECNSGFYDDSRHSCRISSVAVARLGYSGRRFLASRFGRFASASGAGAASRVWRGPASRSFSSVPALAEGTQITVKGEQLDALQGGLAGVSDAASAVASLPNPPALSEVGLAVADSSYPTAFLQYVIEGVHLSTGLPWWASIIATTAAIRVLVLPIMIYQMKATARLTLMRPELEKLTNHIKESGYDPKVVEDNQIRMKALFQKYKTSPLSPILGAFIQAPIFMCFFFAIRNMAEKVDSFREGGTLWFTDLSTPDSLFIMPVLSGAFFLLTVELGATDGMQGQPMLGKMKMFLRGLAVLLVPLTASFPKALFCYWLTANVFSIIQAAVFKQKGVKEVLGIPDVSHLAKPSDIPVSPVVTFSQPPRLKGEGRVASSKRQRP